MNTKYIEFIQLLTNYYYRNIKLFIENGEEWKLGQTKPLVTFQIRYGYNNEYMEA